MEGSYNKNEKNKKCLYKKKCLIFVDTKSVFQVINNIINSVYNNKGNI